MLVNVVCSSTKQAEGVCDLKEKKDDNLHDEVWIYLTRQASILNMALDRLGCIDHLGRG